MLHFEGFVLGLSTGAVCLAYCGPVFIPYLLGENARVKQNYRHLFLFLGGRFAAYILTGLIAGLTGSLVFKSSLFNASWLGLIYVLLSVLMILYGFHQFREVCLGTANQKIPGPIRNRWPWLVPVLGGILTGFNICPPFLLAFTEAFNKGTLTGSMELFFWFFAGTSVYFLPLPLIGFVREKKVLRAIGKFAAILAGLYYFFIGILMFIRS